MASTSEETVAQVSSVSVMSNSVSVTKKMLKTMQRLKRVK